MSEKLHKTKGIVLRTTKYGETSIVVSIFTELFGVQSYLLNGVRTSGKKGSGKANLFQPPALLDLVVYHNELKQLNRIREFRWAHIYTHIFHDVPRNAVALFMVELLAKCLKQPESNPELFQFAEDCFLQLDASTGMVTANMPLFFSLHLPVHFGFRITGNFRMQKPFLDLQEGHFISEQPGHPHFLPEGQAQIVAQLLQVMHPDDLNEINLNHWQRREIIQHIETYYALHIHDFGKLKTLPVLRELSD